MEGKLKILLHYNNAQWYEYRENMKMKQPHLMKSHLKGQKKNQKQELYKPFDFFFNLKINVFSVLIWEADLRLLEKDALLWVYAAGEKSSRHVQDALPEDGWVLGDSDGM